MIMAMQAPDDAVKLRNTNAQGLLRDDQDERMRSESLRLIGGEEFSTPFFRRGRGEERSTASSVSDHDVLLGRGGKNHGHKGNENLRHMARSIAPLYAAALKREKPAIADILIKQVQAMEPRGRFLKRNLNGWKAVSNDVAREKASQCLRDTVAALSRHGMLELATEMATVTDTLSSEANRDRPGTLIHDTISALTVAAPPTSTDEDVCRGLKPLQKKRRATSEPIFSSQKRHCSGSTSYNSLPAQDRSGIFRKMHRSGGSIPNIDAMNAGGDALVMQHLAMGDRDSFQNSSSISNTIWEVSEISNDEAACVRLAIRNIDQLAPDDDSALQRLIDRML